MPEELVFIIPSILLFAMLFGFLAWNRWIGYRELISLAEHGVFPQQEDPPSTLRSLRWGLLFSGVGAALSLGLYPLSANEYPNVILGFGPTMLFGLLPLFIGLALILYWRIGRAEAMSEVIVEEFDDSM